MALKIEIFICRVRDLVAVDYTSCNAIPGSICRSDDSGQSIIKRMLVVVNKFLFRENFLPISAPREEYSVVAIRRQRLSIR